MRGALARAALDVAAVVVDAARRTVADQPTRAVARELAIGLLEPAEDVEIDGRRDMRDGTDQRRGAAERLDGAVGVDRRGSPACAGAPAR